MSLRQQKKLSSQEMVVNVIVAEVLKPWNMTTSYLFPVVDKALFQIFNYYVKNVTEVNQIVAIVKFTIKK
jgi:hypothetical protein